MSMNTRSTTPIVEEVYEDFSSKDNSNIHKLESVVIDNTSVDEPKVYQFMSEHPDVALIIMNNDSQENINNIFNSNEERVVGNGVGNFSYNSMLNPNGSGSHASMSYSYSSTTTSHNGSTSFFSSSTTSKTSNGGGEQTHSFFSSSDGNQNASVYYDTYYNAGHGTYKIELPEEEEEEKDTDNRRFSFADTDNWTNVIDLDEIVDLTKDDDESIEHDGYEMEDDVIMID
ncbi:hypothetical protein HANVADRAFT_52808 [Hanseniaspora valbyensis NRRL Y-1626]|uniref:Uncharacterized protein n=1 Tax=Hanseniaspora valbyensis NRRL Y-1626 TaxID=766949 RepID=A0A1B7TDD7_9ASCO|nr:hypothetical protein HANVADRAFT_52808 [Hanseniaspora valbyensis NRRL Y-1626]